MVMRKRIISALAAAGAIALFGGCFGSSPSSRFYTLMSDETCGISADKIMEVVVRVGPVSIPSTSDRRQIVTRNGRNGIEIAEFERWGGTLEDEIMRLLVHELSARLSDTGIVVVQWRSVTLTEAPTVFRIPLSVERFDGVLGGTVVLNATWTLVEKKDKWEKVLMARESTITETVAGRDYDALVAAMGTAVRALGKEMADGIKSVPGQRDLKE